MNERLPRFDAKGVREHFEEKHDEFVRQETLKAVGEWLEKRLHCGGHGNGKTYTEDYIGLKASEIDALKQGKFPE